MIQRLGKISLGQIAFLSAVFFVLALGLYALTNWGIDFGWIGIFLIGGGLIVLVSFFDTVMETTSAS